MRTVASITLMLFTIAADLLSPDAVAKAAPPSVLLVRPGSVQSVAYITSGWLVQIATRRA